MNEISALQSKLERVNDIIFAKGLVIGSDDYFEVRELCTEHLKSLTRQECEERRSITETIYGKLITEDEAVRRWKKLFVFK